MGLQSLEAAIKQSWVRDSHQALVPLEEASKGEQGEKWDNCMGSAKPYGVLWRAGIGRLPASEKKTEPLHPTLFRHRLHSGTPCPLLKQFSLADADPEGSDKFVSSCVSCYSSQTAGKSFPGHVWGLTCVFWSL